MPWPANRDAPVREDQAADLVAKIESTKDLDADGNKQLAAVIEEFKKELGITRAYGEQYG